MLSDQEVERIIRDYLPGVAHMSLGTSVDNKPWVCEVHFVYDDELIYTFAQKNPGATARKLLKTLT